MNKTRTKISAVAVALVFICSAASAQPPDTLDIKRTTQLKSPLGNSAIPGKLRIFEAANSGSQRIELRAPMSMPINVNLILPITQPATGNVLTAITSDSLGWSTPSGTGDITSVVAGNGLKGGGVSGDVTLDVNVKLAGTGLLAITGDSIHVKAIGISAAEIAANAVTQPKLLLGTGAGDASTLTLHDLISGSPSVNDVIKWNGTNWIPSASAGSALTVREVDLSPSVGSVSVLEFLQTDGFVVTDQTGGTARVAHDSTSWLATDFNVSLRQLKSDTVTYDATKTYVNTRGFLTTVTTGNIVDGTITGDDINANLAGSGLVLTAGAPDILDFSPSELLNITFGNGGAASGSITFNLNGTTDPAITFTDGVVNISAGALQEGTNAVPNATDNLSFFASTTSAQLAGILSNETGGSGLAVFNSNPTIAGATINGGDLILNDGTTDSPLLTFTPQTGTAWSLLATDADDDLEIRSASTVGAENIDIVNPGTGAANLAVEGSISAINFSGSSSGTNTGDQTITLSGDVSGSGTGSITTTIGADKILESMLKAVNAAADEKILTFEVTIGDFEWHTPAELSLQPLEATLTDIADGTIDENLVNTANPWAVNEGGTGAATFTLNGVLYGNATLAIQATAQGGANTVLIANAGAPSFSGQPTLATGIVTKGQNAIEIDPHGAAAGNTGEIRALELAATGTNYVAFKAPDALAATTTYMLPRKGSAITGQVLHINATADSLYWDTDDGAGGGAPIDATYITQTANGSLTNEQALALLATGMMASTTTTGVIATRILTGTAGAITITSGDGSGNPTFTLPAAITVPTSYAVGADPGDAGVIRLENAATIAWEASPAGVDVTLNVDVNEIMQVSSTLNAATLTEGANAVPNAADNLGFFSATTSAQLFGVLSDETGSAIGSPLAMFNQNPTLAGATVNGGNVSFNDGVGDSPIATFTPATGTAWNIFTQDVDDDLQIQSANTVAAETVVMTNPGTGAVNLSIEGSIVTGTWSATVIDEAKLDLTLTVTPLNASGVITTLGTVAGTIDAGAATSLEIPNALNPSTTVEGQIAWDSNNDALEVHNGTDSRILSIRMKSIHATIVDPDVVQPIVDAVSIFSVETEMFPFGITLISCGIKTNVSSTYSVNFEEWTAPIDAAPSTIELVATAATTEAEDDGTLTDASIAAGSIIKVNLPTTNIGELVVWLTYVINEGN